MSCHEESTITYNGPFYIRPLRVCSKDVKEYTQSVHASHPFIDLLTCYLIYIYWTATPTRRVCREEITIQKRIYTFLMLFWFCPQELFLYRRCVQKQKSSHAQTCRRGTVTVGHTNICTERESKSITQPLRQPCCLSYDINMIIIMIN